MCIQIDENVQRNIHRDIRNVLWRIQVIRKYLVVLHFIFNDWKGDKIVNGIIYLCSIAWKGFSYPKCLNWLRDFKLMFYNMRIPFPLLHILIYPQCRWRKHIYTKYNKVTLVLRFQTLIAQKISSNKINFPYTPSPH